MKQAEEFLAALEQEDSSALVAFVHSHVRKLGVWRNAMCL